MCVLPHLGLVSSKSDTYPSLPSKLAVWENLYCIPFYTVTFIYLLLLPNMNKLYLVDDIKPYITYILPDPCNSLSKINSGK